MSPIEEKIYKTFARFRTQIFSPLSRILTVLRVTADMLSYLGAIVMAAFILVLTHHPRWALALLAGRMLIDITDGPLARYQKTDSDRGKFVDVLMDNVSFWLFLVGIVRIGYLHAASALVYLFLTELCVLLVIFKYNLNHKSSWFFYASAGSYPYNFVYAMYALFAYLVLGGNNYLNGAALIFSVLLGFKILIDYRTVQKASPKN